VTGAELDETTAIAMTVAANKTRLLFQKTMEAMEPEPAPCVAEQPKPEEGT